MPHPHSLDELRVADHVAQQSAVRGFDLSKVLHDLHHYLPSQTPLKDFIHHNSLHAFQHSKFYDAIFQASSIFGYQVTLELRDYRTLFKNGRIKEAVLDRCIRERKGADATNTWKEALLHGSFDEKRQARIGSLRAKWKQIHHIDLDNAVHPILFRILAGYLDQGISTWTFPQHQDGLIASLRALEEQSVVSLFQSKRTRRLLLDSRTDVESLMKLLVGTPEHFSNYLFDQQFAHQGWSGMVATLERQPNALLDQRSVSLHDLIVLDCLLEIDALDQALGETWEPLSKHGLPKPIALFENKASSTLEEVLRLWQDAFEWSYYDEVLQGLLQTRSMDAESPEKKSFQALFCIDERECSLRRHIEHINPHCETLGTPGFFGVEFYFQPTNAKFYDKLCPAPVTPKYLIKELDGSGERHHEWLYQKAGRQLLPGLMFSLTAGFAAGWRMADNLMQPKMSPAISNAFIHMNKKAKLTVENIDPDMVENGLQVGFTVKEMTDRVEALLRSVGLIKDFAPLVYLIAHGSSSANNPHHGAHDCGACSGRPGSVNARVMATMANHPKVREMLAERGLVVPSETRFLGALHDTAADQIEFYDEDLLLAEDSIRHAANKDDFEHALDRNAKERSRRFASIDTKADLRRVRKAIKDRSVSLFEPRPELGHGTNTLCIVGSRALTKQLFLDRRAFLNSYDYRTDPEGKLLVGVMKPLGPVCGGINLEYYFSRVDNLKLGAGTKLPHNVVGLIGVANSCDGDLRPGLPLQMIEVHDPVRLLIVVEHRPDVILKTIQSIPEMYEWYHKEWVHLVAADPDSGKLFRYRDGAFHPYQTSTGHIERFGDFESRMEAAKEMETNLIVDATRENMPVYSLH